MEQQAENDRPLPINMTQSYLEMARYWAMHAQSGNAQDQLLVSINTLYAIFAHTYIFSYMALQAFVAKQLEAYWNAPTATLRSKYPAHTTFDELLSRQDGLGDLKEAIKELCKQNHIRQIHEADRRLWPDFTNFVREARNYFSHPKPGSAFDMQIERLRSRQSLIFPVDVTQRIIEHFYRETYTPLPKWVKSNQELFPLSSHMTSERLDEEPHAMPESKEFPLAENRTIPTDVREKDVRKFDARQDVQKPEQTGLETMQTVHIQEISPAGKTTDDDVRKLKGLAKEIFEFALKDDLKSHFLLEFRNGATVIFRVSTEESLKKVLGYLDDKGIPYHSPYPYPAAPDDSIQYGEDMNEVVGRHLDLFLPVFHAHCVAATSLSSEEFYSDSRASYLERVMHIACDDRGLRPKDEGLISLHLGASRLLHFGVPQSEWRDKPTVP